MKKASVKYIVFGFLLVALLGFALWNDSSNSITSAAAVNPEKSDWSGGIGPPPPGNAIDTFGSLRNQVLTREGHVPPEQSSSKNAQAAQSSTGAFSASGLFSLALNKITGGGYHRQAYRNSWRRSCIFWRRHTFL